MSTNSKLSARSDSSNQSFFSIKPRPARSSIIWGKKEKEESVIQKDESLLFPWGPKFFTGIEMIDVQHKGLVDRYNVLVNHFISGNEDRNEIGFLLDDLIDYTNHHFSCEEKLQKLIKYPTFKKHSGIHRKFVRTIEKYQEKFNYGENLTTTLIKFLKDWLADHILKEDPQIAAYLNKNLHLYKKKVAAFHKKIFNEIEHQQKDRKHVLASSLSIRQKRKKNKFSFILDVIAPFWNSGSFIFVIFSVLFTLFFTIMFLFFFFFPSFFSSHSWVSFILFFSLLSIAYISFFGASFGIYFIIAKTLNILSFEMNRVCNLNLNKKSKIRQLNRLGLHEFSNLDYTFRKFLVGIENFLKFTPLEIMAQIMRSNEIMSLGMKKKMCTYVFNDIESFTTISESTSSGDLVLLLERFFKINDSCVSKYGGTILSYLGDGLLISFNASKYVINHPIKAVLCCLETIEELAEINKLGDVPQIKIRIGINTDQANVGIVGSSYRMFYSVIGDAVNTSARLEALNKVYGSTIMCSDKTMHLIKNKEEVKSVSIRWLDQVKLTGKNVVSNVYELRRKKPAVDDEDVRNKNYAKICALSMKIKKFYDLENGGEGDTVAHDEYTYSSNDNNKEEKARRLGIVRGMLEEIQKLNPLDVPVYKLLKRIHETNSLVVFKQTKSIQKTVIPGADKRNSSSVVSNESKRVSQTSKFPTNDSIEVINHNDDDEVEVVEGVTKYNTEILDIHNL